VTDVTASALADALRDRYTLERELGRGGMATVYLARDLKHDRPVALKVLRPQLAHALGPERFLREIQVTARLQHPHILPVFDSGEAAGQLWYTMPYVVGESLRERLTREGRLSVDEALRITREVADALQHAHAQDVVHRDIKPENILLAGEHALVADFGIAKAAHTAGERLTETGISIGTVAYMSPEQAAGAREVDHRSDLYSLGCVVYEMLTGVPPHSAQAVLARRLADTPRPLRQVRETVPEVIEEAVLRALAKAPADRFQSAAEFAQAITVRATAPSSPTRVAVTAAPPLRSRILALVGVVLALLAGFTMLAVRERSGVASHLDSNVLVIVPFDVLDPSLQLWREGLVDLLSRNLDGAGPLRTVSPTVVLRRWRGRADRTSAERLARGIGAGLALYGSLVPTGHDSVRLAASVVDLPRGRIAAEADLRGDSGRLDQLADSLSLRVLRGLGRTHTVGALRESGIGSRSLPALRAFLRGEQYFRRAEWDSARVYYEAAATEDTAFGLAYWRLGTVRGWVTGVNDSLSRAYSLRAGELNHGMAPRESLLITCHSLMATLEEGDTPDSATESHLQQLFRTATEVTRSYPTDPESWVALGEARFHFGNGRGVSNEMSREAFSRAIALDSAYAPAYIHGVELAVTMGDRTAAREFAQRFLDFRPGAAHATAMRAASLLLDPAASDDDVARMLDSIPVRVLFNVYLVFMNASDAEEIGIALIRRLTARRVPEDQWYHEPEIRRAMLAGILSYRGHGREAAALLMAREERAAWPQFAELALLGLVPPDTADAVFRRRLHKEPFWPPIGLPFAPAWWATRRDSVSLKLFIQRYQARAAPASPSEAAIIRYRIAAAGAYLALVRADTADAVARLQALPIATGSVYLERLTLARLLQAQGRDREALAVLERGFPSPYPTLSRAPWALDEARLAERLGEREKAEHWYSYVAALWRNADPELQPSVTEAKEALARLTAESGT